MVSFAPTSRETLEDQLLYTRARLTEVACLDCMAKVGVKKNSEHHTSIQWDSESLGACAEFQRMAAEPGGRHVHASCSRLRSSINRAVAEGKIEIGAEDGC
jgi:hypothetical protein